MSRMRAWLHRAEIKSILNESLEVPDGLTGLAAYNEHQRLRMERAAKLGTLGYWRR